MRAFYRRDVNELTKPARVLLILLRLVTLLALVFFFFDLQRRTERWRRVPVRHSGGYQPEHVIANGHEASSISRIDQAREPSPQADSLTNYPTNIASASTRLLTTQIHADRYPGQRRRQQFHRKQDGRSRILANCDHGDRIDRHRNSSECHFLIAERLVVQTLSDGGSCRP